MGQGREHPCQAGDKVGFEQRFERGGLNLAEKELGSLVGLGLGCRVQGRGQNGPGASVTKSEDPGHCPQGSGSHRGAEA